jgi:hypothetical protein
MAIYDHHLNRGLVVERYVFLARTSWELRTESIASARLEPMRTNSGPWLKGPDRLRRSTRFGLACREIPGPCLPAVLTPPGRPRVSTAPPRFFSDVRARAALAQASIAAALHPGVFVHDLQPGPWRFSRPWTNSSIRSSSRAFVLSRHSLRSPASKYNSMRRTKRNPDRKPVQGFDFPDPRSRFPVTITRELG